MISRSGVMPGFVALLVASVKLVLAKVAQLVPLLLLCLLCCGISKSVAADTPAPVWLNIADKVSVQVDNPVRSRRSPDATVKVTVKNTSGAVLTGPVRLVLQNLTASVSLKDKAGDAASGPYRLLLALDQPLAANSVISLNLTILGGAQSFQFTPLVEQAQPGCSNGAGNYPDCNDNALQVKISSPLSLVTLGHSPVLVKGTINKADAVLVVNGNQVAHQSGQFSTEVTVTEGYNTIIASASLGTAQVTDTVSVSLDLTPPYVTLESHTEGQVVYQPEVTITGLVNDIVRGTIEASQAQVRVNGVEAEVKNRSYAARNVPLVAGSNVIRIVASDQVGNTERKEFNLVYQQAVGKRLALVSGQDQSAAINTVLPQPLVVKVVDSQGAALAGEAVVFRVLQDSGVVAAGSAAEGRAVVLTSDAEGLVSTKFKVGLRTGVANNKVKVAAVGIEGDLVFSASATTTKGDKLSINSGNNQRGVVGQVLPAPLVAVVTDAGANVVAGAKVKFETVSGNGKFENNQQSIEVETDSDGRATVRYVLGDLEGLDAQKIQASLVDNTTGPQILAGFSASAFVAADPGLTKISGVVLDNQDNPIPGVTMYLENSSRQARTDATGRFVLTSVPVGPVHLIADGSTAGVAGEFPSLSFRLVTIAGVDNPLPAPIYMVKLNTKEAVYAGKEDVVLTLAKYPGFKLEIAKDSVTFPDGAREGYISVTAVNASAVPMAPPNGMQPQFIVTIQPTGTMFDAPARLTLPNVDGHAAGAQVEMYSYDHDLEEFVAIGLGTVSEDATVIKTNPGVGVVKAGWHCGSQPGGSGTAANCPECQKCIGTSCQPDPGQNQKPLKVQQPEDCKTATCGGSIPDDNDAPAKDPVEGDCKKPGCMQGAVTDVESNSDISEEDAKCNECNNKQLKPAKENNACGDGSAKQSCLRCVKGVCKRPDCDASPIKQTFSNTAPQFVIDAITGFSRKFDAVPWFQAKLTPELMVNMEVGEACCKDCENPVEAKSYKKFNGRAGVKGTVKATVPWGAIKELPPKVIGGYAVKADFFVSALGADININAGGSVNYTAIDCPGENCGSFSLGSSFSANLGPQLQGSMKFVSCEDPTDEKCKKGVTLVSIGFKGFAGINLGGSINGTFSSGAQCGASGLLILKLNPVYAQVTASGSFEILFKSYSVSWTEQMQLHPGGSW
jgi:hypothetical protein